MLKLCAKEHFELDRSGNPPGEELDILKSQPLVEAYREHEAAIHSMVCEVAGESLDFQTPYFVRYSPTVRPSLEAHIDRSAWTCVIYLNSDFSGGELIFPTLGLSVAPRAGYGVIFPGGYLYPHSSATVRSGTKYALILMTNTC